MATLEKIRSKSVFLFVIIIVALLAFILGDFLTSGRSYFGTGTTMMKAGSAKVDYNDYKNASENMQRNAQNNKQDAAEMEQVILQQLLMQQLVEEQYDKLGIKVTDSQISRLMTTPNPYTAQFIGYLAQQLNLPAADGKTIRDAIENPSRYGLNPQAQEMLKQIWINQEQQLEQGLKSKAFMSLIDGLFTANELDAKSLYDDNMANTAVQYVSVPLSTIPDDEVEVTDADLKAKYNDYKAMYTLSQTNPGGVIEPVRAIDYVVVNIEPSNADIAAAQTEVAAAVKALEEQPGLEGLTARQHFMHETVNVPVADVKKNADLRTLPEEALVPGNVHPFRFNRSTNTYTIAKVQDIRPEVDEIYVSMYAAQTPEKADSIVNLIKGGKSFAEATAEAQPGQAIENQKNTLVGAPAGLKERMLAEPVGTPFVYSEGGANVVYLINDRKDPVDYAEIAVIKYVVDPSATTISDLKTQLNSFLASNSRGDLFSENAESLYRLQHGFVSASSPRIGNVEDTRKAVKWAMNANPGKVSRVFEGHDAYVVVAVKDVYTGEYLPYDAQPIKDFLTNEVKKDKKAAKLIEQYQGKASDIEGYAQLMNSEVRTDDNAVFTSTRLGSFAPSTEYALQGAVGAAKEGQLIGPMQGAQEVAVIAVGPTTVTERPYDFEQDGGAFMTNFGLKFDQYGRQPIDPVMLELLLGGRKVTNYSLNFVVDED